MTTVAMVLATWLALSLVVGLIFGQLARGN